MAILENGRQNCLAVESKRPSQCFMQTTHNRLSEKYSVDLPSFFGSQIFSGLWTNKPEHKSCQVREIANWEKSSEYSSCASVPTNPHQSVRRNDVHLPSATFNQIARRDNGWDTYNIQRRQAIYFAPGHLSLVLSFKLLLVNRFTPLNTSKWLISAFICCTSRNCTLHNSDMTVTNVNAAFVLIHHVHNGLCEIVTRTYPNNNTCSQDISLTHIHVQLLFPM